MASVTPVPDRDVAEAAAPVAGPAGRAFADLHTHSRASFDSLASPASMLRTAASRGLTHLAITDHDRIDGALEARRIAADIAPSVTVIVGEEIKTLDGDLVALHLTEAVPPGLPADEAIAVVRAQGGLIGIPHPFDRFRGSLLRDERMEDLVDRVDWVEAHNARIAVGKGNQMAAELAVSHGKPGIAVSDAHSAFEVGVAYTVLDGDLSTADGLRAALANAELVLGRASFVVRLWTPIAKTVQRMRGNCRVRPPGDHPLSVGP
jgi:predicted metal-dependent phosphoesterase TrpH